MYEVPIPCQKDRLRENRTGGAKREGFIEDLGHKLPRGILLCVCAYVCACVRVCECVRLRGFLFCLYVCMLSRVSVSVTQQIS